MVDPLNAKMVYCIGIGGIGVSGLAEWLLHHGIAVHGSDLCENQQTERLKKLGAVIYRSHESSQISGADLVVYTSAVDKLVNPELLAAQSQGISCISRGELLACIMHAQNNIVVTGTHGKTTTTAMVAKTLSAAGQNPSYMIGGLLRDEQSPVRCGGNDYFVAEADESDASFLFLSPKVAVITNIDADHMETYGYNFDSLTNSFLAVTKKIPSDGFVVACIDDAVVRALLPEMHCRVITYGCREEADYRLVGFNQTGLVGNFQVCSSNHAPVPVRLNMPGLHNALNATVAVVLSMEFGVPLTPVLGALQAFPGVGRRFHHRGDLALSKGGEVSIYDDYGHHPKEIQATLSAAKAAWPDRRVILVFQPHRFTRTRDLFQDFVSVLKEADLLVLTAVYAASETPIEGADGMALYESVVAAGAKSALYVPDLNSLPESLMQIAQPQDIIIFQGAGNIVSTSGKLVSMTCEMES